MKHYFFSTIAIAALCALSFSACQQNPESAMSFGPATPMSTGVAHPAITYVSTPLINNVQHYAIGVMDTDGTHKTNLVTSSGSDIFQTPTWSPTGSSIIYNDFSSNSNSALKAFDVSVNGSGIPVASNARTVYSVATADSMNLGSPAWSSFGSTGKIAFIRQHMGSKLGLSELCTIAEGGGSVTVLASYSHLNAQGVVMSHYTCPTWSSDDSKIAVIREDTILKSTIMIFDASTGSALDSIPFSGSAASLEWSRSGLNKLVYSYHPNSSTASKIYYVVPSTGSIPSTNSVVGTYPTWSPNNSGIMFSDAALKKIVEQTSTSSTIATSPGGSNLKWKR